MTRADFEHFYRTHIDKVYRFVFFRAGYDRELAEDLVSAIFLKALQHFDSYDEARSKTSWIMTIAKNHLANYWRDNKKTSSLPDQQEVADEETTTGDNFWLKEALQQLQKHNVKIAVYELVAKLEPTDAEIVTFHYLMGYSYAEIAEMKGISAGAVKVAAHRAIKKLRRML